MSNNRIKKFREAWEDDEWGSDDQQAKSKGKEKKKRDRKAERDHKFSDRWYDDDMNIKNKQ